MALTGLAQEAIALHYSFADPLPIPAAFAWAAGFIAAPVMLNLVISTPTASSSNLCASCFTAWAFWQIWHKADYLPFLVSIVTLLHTSLTKTKINAKPVMTNIKDNTTAAGA
jgi:hypothetical protein